jgi:ADP-ribosyl-[dinitrogen reductase] hydrolase
LCWSHDATMAIEMAGESSRTTHAAATAVDGCRYFATLIVGAVRGVEKETLLASQFSADTNCWEESPLDPEIHEIASGSFKRRRPPQIESTGYVVRTLEAALWAFHRSASFEEGCRLALNLGGDADTCGGAYGQLAGAFYGEHGIPERWLKVLAHRPLIESMAEKLHHIAFA